MSLLPSHAPCLPLLLPPLSCPKCPWEPPSQNPTWKGVGNACHASSQVRRKKFSHIPVLLRIIHKACCRHGRGVVGAGSVWEGNHVSPWEKVRTALSAGRAAHPSPSLGWVGPQVGEFSWFCFGKSVVSVLPECCPTTDHATPEHAHPSRE